MVELPTKRISPFGGGDVLSAVSYAATFDSNRSGVCCAAAGFAATNPASATMRGSMGARMRERVTFIDRTLMRYLVTARVKPGCREALDEAIDNGTLGAGSIAGDEYLHNMAEARA